MAPKSATGTGNSVTGAPGTVMRPPSETTALISDKAQDAEDLKRLKAYQPYAFFVTFGGYLMAHFSRKCYSTVKKELQTEAGFSSLVLTSMDTIFMGSYAIGNIVNGKLGDTIRPTTVLAAGLFGSSVCLFGLCLILWTDLEGHSILIGNTVIISIYFVFGLFQATGGPVGTVVMGNWYCDKDSLKNRGSIFGFWTCHQYVGDIVAQFCTVWVLGIGWDYRVALLIPAVFNCLWGFIALTLVPDPAEANIMTDEVKQRLANLEKKRLTLKASESADNTELKAITFIDALRIPMVLQYALAFGFFKLTNYTLFFWLPYFLEKHFSHTTANTIASLYSFGMMPGGIIVGYVSDLFGGRRASVIGVFMGLLVVFLFIFSQESEVLSPTALLPMLFVMGLLVGGPNNIITSAVCADLSSHPTVKGSSKSLGTITGLINGMGAVTASAGLLAINPLQNAFGWGSVWIYLIGCTSCGTLLMATKIYEELVPSAKGGQKLTAEV